MFKILHKETFSPTTFLWEVEAPDIAQACQPGQFVMVRLKDGGERVPLTVADFNRKAGTITMVVKVVGKTTEEMSTYAEGGTFLDFIGPFGSPSVIKKLEHVVLIGGGLGVAPIFPILRAFKNIGTPTTTVIGFRSTAEVFWLEKFQNLSDVLHIMSEDGSVGRRGNVVDALNSILSQKIPIDEVLAVGPLAMMEAVAEATRPYKIHTLASMNSIMVDGIGMCGSCRVTVGGKVLFACIDGPDMDAHQVDFSEMKIRQTRFREEEQESLNKYRQECALKKKGILL